LQTPAAQATVAAPVEISARAPQPAIAAVRPPVDIPAADASPSKLDSEFKPDLKSHAGSEEPPAEDKAFAVHPARALPKSSDPLPIKLPEPAASKPFDPVQPADPPKLMVMARGIPDLPSPNQPSPPTHIASVTPPTLVLRVSPVYPTEALRVKQEGTVTLQAHVSKQGRVIKVSVLNGEEPFEKPAIAAVMRWRYQPAMLDGAPAESDVNVVLNFRIPK